jgi:hypothetical protein
MVIGPRFLAGNSLLAFAGCLCGPQAPPHVLLVCFNQHLVLAA